MQGLGHRRPYTEWIQRMVVFPALSRPSTRMRASLSPNNVASNLDTNMPMALIPCLFAAQTRSNRPQIAHRNSLCTPQLLSSPLHPDPVQRLRTTTTNALEKQTTSETSAKNDSTGSQLSRLVQL
jgi:hypothetical protein